MGGGGETEIMSGGGRCERGEAWGEVEGAH